MMGEHVFSENNTSFKCNLHPYRFENEEYLMHHFDDFLQ